MNSDIKDSPDYKDLKRLIIGGAYVVFVGSGLSIEIYPSWEDLIKQLCERCGIEGISSEEKVSTELLMEKADEAKRRNRELYNHGLKEIFRPVIIRREAYELIMRLRSKFYVTINFDPLLANESRRPEHSCDGIYWYPDLPYRSKRAIYYIHGIVKDDDQSEPNIILGKNDFDAGYSKESILYSFLHQVLTYEPILFIGCGLREPQLREMFRICHETRKKIELSHNTTAPSRYILLPYKLEIESKDNTVKRNKNEEEQEANIFRELGINAIRYDPKDMQHSGLEELLRDLCQLPPITYLRGFDSGEP